MCYGCVCVVYIFFLLLPSDRELNLTVGDFLGTSPNFIHQLMDFWWLAILIAAALLQTHVILIVRIAVAHFVTIPATQYFSHRVMQGRVNISVMLGYCVYKVWSITQYYLRIIRK